MKKLVNINKFKYSFFFFSKLMSSLFSKFLNKGKRTKVEFIFNKFFHFIKTKRKFYFYFVLLDSLTILKPEIGVRIYKFSKNKKLKRRKKGYKKHQDTKVFPLPINDLKKFKIGLSWIISRIKKSSYSLIWSLLTEFINVISFNKNSALVEKTKLRKLVLLNRGSTHYRW